MIPTGLAIFDLDGTLLTGDSLWPFLVRLVGRRRVARALAQAVAAGLSAKDRKTAIKARLLALTLADVPLSQVHDVANWLAKDWRRWNKPLYDVLLSHKQRGHRILVATGALDLYATRLLADLPVDAILCTRMESRDGVLTGRMVDGNCVRDVKAQQVQDWINQNGPFSASWGYGNPPSDLPFLELVDHAVIVPTARR